MATNKNTGWSNGHTLYCAASGGGKSQALRANKEIPKKGARVLIWDPDEDHDCIRAETRAHFLKLVLSGLKKGGGFRVGLTVDSENVKDFEWFCEVVWRTLNGDRQTYIIIEELADVSPSPAKATPIFGKVLRRSRKYGGVIHATTQRPSEISKTCYTQCGRKFIGVQEGDDVAKMAKVAKVSIADIEALTDLSFWYKASGANPAVKIKVKYKAVPKG